jgi:hypothetical protein
LEVVQSILLHVVIIPFASIIQTVDFTALALFLSNAWCDPLVFVICNRWEGVRDLILHVAKIGQINAQMYIGSETRVLFVYMTAQNVRLLPKCEKVGIMPHFLIYKSNLDHCA